MKLLAKVFAEKLPEGPISIVLRQLGAWSGVAASTIQGPAAAAGTWRYFVCDIEVAAGTQQVFDSGPAAGTWQIFTRWALSSDHQGIACGYSDAT